MHLSEVEQMPLEEFMRWLAWYRVEQNGSRAADFRAAAICQAVANGEAYTAELKKNRKTLPISRFFRDPWSTREQCDIVGQMKEFARRFRTKKGVDSSG